MIERIGPYRIEEKLGVGGMGEVFKAFDQRLDRWVAIKRIRPEKIDEDNRVRLLREARATARLNHASIVHVYDIFQDGSSDCIVMEFVEGRPLDTLISAAPLEPMRVAAIGHEIASGLAEAHSKAILHRDLKVENIILTPEGRAKILDFGLAKPLLKEELDSSLTGKGQLVGTSRAMSPEYVSGEDVDHRSDLFALGVLLYEAATGHSPFKAHNTLATLKQVMLTRQQAAHEVDPNIPKELSDVIEALLEKDPDDRPQSAVDVARDLGRICGRVSSEDVLRPSSSVVARPRSGTASVTQLDLSRPHRRRWLAAAVAAAVVIALIAIARWRAGQSGLDFAERDSVVVGDFQNLTGEALLDDSVEQAFRVGLEQSRFANVLSQAQVQEALDRMEQDSGTELGRELGREVCLREGAKALILGSIGKVGATYALDARIIDPQSDRIAFATDAQADNQDEILPALERITQRIRAKLGEALPTIAVNQPLARVTTSDLQALKAYSLGVAETDSGRENDAVPLFEQALALDPEFAMAHAKLGTIYLNLDRGRRIAAGHFTRALESADRLTQFEKLYVEGWMANLSGVTERMISAWALTSQVYPERFVGHHNLGMVKWLFQNRFEEAIRSFEAAAETTQAERRSLAYRHLGYCQLALERYDDARISLDQVVKSESNWLALSFAELLLATGETAAAKDFLGGNRDQQSVRWRVEADLRTALADADRGLFRRAHEPLRRALGLAEGEGLEHLAAALHVAVLSAASAGDDSELFWDRFAAAESAALGLLQAETNMPPTLAIPTLAVLGKLSVVNGDVAGGERISTRVDEAIEGREAELWQAYRAMLKAEILAAKGETDEAIATLREAISATDSYQFHESLARIAAAASDTETAVAEYGWIADRRGRSFAECLDGPAPCVDRMLNVIAWADALLQLGDLHVAAGKTAQAAELYERFLEQRGEGDPSASVRRVEEALEALGPAAEAQEEIGWKSRPSGSSGAGTPQPQIARAPSRYGSILNSASAFGPRIAAEKKAPRPSSAAHR